MFAAIGGLVTLPIVAYTQNKMGSAKCLLFGNLLLAGVQPILGITGVGLALLYPMFFCVGIGLAFADMAMTAQGVAVEKELYRNQMGFFQAMLSIGNFVGVLFGGAVAYVGLTPLENFMILSAASMPVTCISYQFLMNHEEELRLHTPNDVKENEKDEAEMSLTHSKGDTEMLDTEDEGNIISNVIICEQRKEDADMESSSMPLTTRNMLAYLSASGLCAQIGEGTIGDWSVAYLLIYMLCTESRTCSHFI